MKYTKSDMSHRFMTSIHELMASKTHNVKILSRTQYAEMIQKVKISKGNPNKTHEDYQRLRRYDVVADGNLEKLITPSKHGHAGRYYVHYEELFEVIHETHITIGHGGRNRMEKNLTSKYKNISRDMIAAYIQLCKTCEKKQMSKQAEETSIINTELNARGQVDLIDMRAYQDGQYKFILVYRDHATKFVQTRPLKTNLVREVTSALLDIFTLFGAPNILQSARGRDFSNEIIEDMTVFWPDLKMVHGIPKHSRNQEQERVNREIENILRTWMTQNNSHSWTEGIRFVQLIMNRTYNPEINCSPFEAMFGTSIRVGLPSAELPREIICEEQLRAFLIN